MHCPLSAEVPGRVPGAWEEEEPHGWVWSLTRTPFSRASCSRVMGMKEPGKCMLAIDHKI